MIPPFSSSVISSPRNSNSSTYKYAVMHVNRISYQYKNHDIQHFNHKPRISLKLTSKIRVALGGIFGGLPADPYAYSGLQMSWHNSPIFIVATPMSHAFITWPKNSKASLPTLSVQVWQVNVHIPARYQTNLCPAQRKTSLLGLGLNRNGCHPEVCPHNVQTLCHRSWAVLCLCLPFLPAGKQARWSFIHHID